MLLRESGSWRRRGVTVVAVAVIGATACGAIAGAAPAYAADAENPEICPPSVSNPPPRPAAAGPLPDLVLEFLKGAAGSAGGEAFSFAMSLLGRGDRTAAQLQEISEQLARMDAKLNALQDTANEIKQRVNQAAFTALMVKFKDLKADVESINDHGMRPVALAAANLAKVMSEPTTPERIEEAVACLNQKKEFFETFAGTKGADNNVQKIANLMSSEATEDQLVNGYGRLLAQHNRYLFTRHSEALRAFYDYLEQYQALAAIQKAEWQIANRIPTAIIQESNERFSSRSARPGRPSPRPGWIESQRAVLPDAIPRGIVIDVGAAGDTTLGKTMLCPETDRIDTITWRDPDEQGHSTGQAEAVSMASRFICWGASPTPLRNWRIVNAAEWNSFVAGKAASSSGADYLNGTFNLRSGGEGVPPPFGINSFVWVDSAAHRHPITLHRFWGSKWYYPLHTGVFVGRSGPLNWDPKSYRPGDLPSSTWATKEALKEQVRQAFDRGKGSLLLSRTVDVNYMAVKSSPPSP